MNQQIRAAELTADHVGSRRLNTSPDHHSRTPTQPAATSLPPPRHRATAQPDSRDHYGKASVARRHDRLDSHARIEHARRLVNTARGTKVLTSCVHPAFDKASTLVLRTIRTGSGTLDE